MMRCARCIELISRPDGIAGAAEIGKIMLVDERGARFHKRALVLAFARVVSRQQTIQVGSPVTISRY
jgi:hypothetical protein